MPMTAVLLDGFVAFQVLRGLSQETIKRRTVTVRLFRRYVDPVSLVAVTPELIEEWLGLIPVASTRRAYRSDLVALYRWARKRGLVDVDPTLDLEGVRVPRGLPRPVDAALIGDIIRFAPNRETQLAIALGAYAGLRRFEIANLHRDDVLLHAAPPVIVVRLGKGGKDRVVPIHPELAAILHGLPAGPVCPLRPDTIGRKVAAHLRDFGVDATLHQLRHTFGTEAARASNGNVLVVKELLGHASPETTVRYTALAATLTASTVATMYAEPA